MGETQTDKIKLGLVLEGGGARGAYQSGVLRALFEAGYKFDGVTGTSIGALNGVMIAQNKFEQCEKVWQELGYSKCFDVDEDYADKLIKRDIDGDTVKYFLGFAKNAIKKGGIDTSRLKNIIESNIDEKDLRESGLDFGIMTYSLTEHKPFPIFLEDMPEGTAADYVMASASFPGFQQTTIGEHSFVDGGVVDNMPINMLIDKGYEDIVAIETMSMMRKGKPKEDKVQILYIRPSEKPGRMLDFRTESVERAIKVGYYDALRVLKGYKGEKYYFDVSGVTPFGYGLCDMPSAVYFKISRLLGELYTGHNDLLKLINKTFKMKYLNLADAFLAIIERVATALDIQRLEIYTISELIAKIQARVNSELQLYNEIKYQQELLIVNILAEYMLSRSEE